MPQNTSIFENAIRNENAFTELLCNYMRFDPFRSAFLQLLGEKIKFDHSTIGPDNFKTQAHIIGSLIPDLQILSDDTEILIEIKVDDVGLTKNQPKGYFKYLEKHSKKRTKALFLLCSSNYIGQKQFMGYFSFCDAESTAVRIHVIFWEQIIDILERECLSDTSLFYSEFLLLLKSQFYIFKPIEMESMKALCSTNVPAALEKLIDNIDSLRRAVYAQGYNVKISSPNDWSEHGFYFDFKSGGTVFFGIWIDHWKLNEDPVCISADDISNDAKSTLSSILREFGFSDLVNIKSEKLNYPTITIDIIYLSDVSHSERLKDMLFKIGQLSKVKNF